jgi:hypothetical protein
MLRLFILFFIFTSNLLFAAACETKREIFVENSTTKVWKTTICPNHRLPFHSHQFARVVISDSDGALQVIYRSGRKKILKLQKETPFFLSAAEGRESHQDLNIGKKALQVTVIEFRKSYKQ